MRLVGSSAESGLQAHGFDVKAKHCKVKQKKKKTAMAAAKNTEVFINGVNEPAAGDDEKASTRPLHAGDTVCFGRFAAFMFLKAR